ncbi:MAG: sigma-54-dependent transcriptional regulator [Pararhodobacter sp.]
MLEGLHIALVEDDEIMGGSILQRLELEGARVVWLKTMHRALGALRTPRQAFDAVVCDIRLPDGSGEDLFNKLCEHGAPPPFLFMTGQGAADQAVRLLRSGAADYLMKPFDMGQFLERLAQVITPPDLATKGTWFGISPKAKALDSDLARLADRAEPVLILGESGTGKRLVAHRLHSLSDRRAAPFVAVDLTRLSPDDMANDILDSDHGAFVRAGEGFLLIERIGQASAELQVRLLTALWASDGAMGPRLIATDGPDLTPEALRPDFYFYLSIVTLSIPAFRGRPEDAVWLMSRLFEGMNARRSVPFRGISPQAEQAVRAHDWPGNGRELRARLMRAVAMAKGETIFPTDLFPEGVPGAVQTMGEGFQPLSDVRDAAERAHIQSALSYADGSLTEAAKLLQIGRSTLWEKMQKLGIDGRG